MAGKEPRAGVQVTVNESEIKRIVDARVKKAILDSLAKNPKEIIQGLVHDALGMKVNSDGKFSNYPSDNRYDFVEVLFAQKVRAATVIAVEQWLTENQDKIKQAILSDLKRRSSEVVGSILDAVTEASKAGYRFTVTVQKNTPS